MTFAREGWPFVLPFFVLGLVLALAHQQGWAIASTVLGIAVLLFFRNPDRHFEGPGSTILAPADGLITLVEQVEEPSVGPGTFHHIVTFLSVFDVHVQRVPIRGRVVASALTRGRKVAAFRPDAGVVNEQHLAVLELAGGERVGIKQIAGLFARRVVCYLNEGDEVERGELMGVIKFGSRVDLYVPARYRVLVAKGDRVKNGSTAMAALTHASQPNP